ncbi:MAG: hypothetical protein J6Y49_01240 [Alphaproteobacteria bacterium]|nr:hypothetical protein [Alphaproteobacteria bacterium]
MSKETTKEITYHDHNGVKRKCIVDAETAQNIGQYKDIYNKIQYFFITEMDLEPRSVGWARKMYIAQSHKLEIRAIKEYLPGVSEDILDHASYVASIRNTKSQEEPKFLLYGIVPILYYNLFEKQKQL